MQLKGGVSRYDSYDDQTPPIGWRETRTFDLQNVRRKSDQGIVSNPNVLSSSSDSAASYFFCWSTAWWTRCSKNWDGKKSLVNVGGDIYQTFALLSCLDFDFFHVITQEWKPLAMYRKFTKNFPLDPWISRSPALPFLTPSHTFTNTQEPEAKDVLTWLKLQDMNVEMIELRGKAKRFFSAEVKNPRMKLFSP